MASNLVFYQLLLVALVLICLLIHVGWPNAPSSAPQTSRKPTTRRRKRATDPKPFPGFIHKPLCDAEVDPNTVLRWLVEAADQLQAFSCHVLHDLRVRQVQMDELFALLSAVRDGEIRETEAIERLERPPQGVWVALDPESKLVLVIDVGNRTLAQRVVHQVAQVLAPDCVPLFLTDGFREYLTALLTHYEQGC